MNHLPMFEKDPYLNLLMKIQNLKILKYIAITLSRADHARFGSTCMIIRGGGWVHHKISYLTSDEV